MNHEVPQPTTATRSPARGIAARHAVSSPSPASATARRQHSGWVRISVSVLLSLIDGLRPCPAALDTEHTRSSIMCEVVRL